MRYISTRGGIPPAGFSDAVKMGLARDGGLLLPFRYPDVRDRLAAWRSLAYPELALEIMLLFTDLPRAVLQDLLRRSYGVFDDASVTPVVPAGPLFLLELFHGPTLAFKDIALQFIGNLFEYLQPPNAPALNVLAATSGDTGSAAIHGFRGRRGMRVFVLHPHGKVSPVQERQMTTVLDENVFNLAVEGTFDDCQSIVKRLFEDLPFRDRYNLKAVNSINWARLLAQVVYYFYGVFRVMEATGAGRVRVSVPTGNFGDVFAGYVAARMGAPIDRLIVATNENDILVRFFETGIYERRRVCSTLSPSMDIQVASNFERYLYHRVGGCAQTVKRLMQAFAADGRIVPETVAPGPGDPLFRARRVQRAETLDTIRNLYERHGRLVDPHTAVGAAAALRENGDGVPVLCLATAHPAKFGEAIRAAIGRDAAHHPRIDALQGLPTRMEVLPACAKAVGDCIGRHVRCEKEGAEAARAGRNKAARPPRPA